MSVEERVLKFEELAADVRDFTKALTEVIKRYDERLDEHDGMFHEANHAIAALADAQIRTEDALKKIIERLDERG